MEISLQEASPEFVDDQPAVLESEETIHPRSAVQRLLAKMQELVYMCFDANCNSTAVGLAQQACRISEEKLGLDDCLTDKQKALAAWAFYKAGQVNKSIELLESVIEGLEREQPLLKHYIPMATSRLIRNLMERGPVEKCVGLLIKFEGLMGFASKHTTQSIAQLARASYDNGQFGEAEELELEFFQAAEAIYGPGSTLTVRSFSRLLDILWQQMKLAQVVALCRARSEVVTIILSGHITIEQERIRALLYAVVHALPREGMLPRGLPDLMTNDVDGVDDDEMQVARKVETILQRQNSEHTALSTAIPKDRNLGSKPLL